MTVRYRAPNDRPGDFDNKLETFFALRGIEPTKTWMVWSHENSTGLCYSSSWFD